MLITGFIANLLGFLFGTSLFGIVISLFLYILVIRYLLLPVVRWLAAKRWQQQSKKHQDLVIASDMK